MDAVKKGFGVLIGAVGVAIVIGADKWIEAQIVGALPDVWVSLTSRF
jgi:Flp pilus assembly pilin Flp